MTTQQTKQLVLVLGVEM
jgi:hypothetical protein